MTPPWVRFPPRVTRDGEGEKPAVDYSFWELVVLGVAMPVAVSSAITYATTGEWPESGMIDRLAAGLAAITLVVAAYRHVAKKRRQSKEKTDA